MNNLDVITIDTNPYKDNTTSYRTSIKLFTLVPETHPALKKILPTFNFEKPPVNPIEFASSLVETCKKYNGIGLSANQCGYEHRVFVMGSDDNFVSFFNPKIISASSGTIKMEEGCLSFPNLFLAVERPYSIEVEYQDFNGECRTARFSGLTARCFQHELDHMNGIVYTNKVSPLSLHMALKKKRKIKDDNRKVA